MRLAFTCAGLLGLTRIVALDSIAAALDTDGLQAVL